MSNEKAHVVSPDIWDAGQTYNVTITGTNFVPGTYLGGSTAYPGCPATYMNITTSARTLSYSYTFASATTITAVVTPTAGDPAATATIAVSGPPTATATAQIVPAPCPVPTVASISPNVWWAGQSYKNVTVTGANFITPANATAVCPATTATITGASFTLGAVTVNSATQITIASVAPPSTEPTEGPTIAVSNEASPQPNVDVLGPPQIQCTGSSMQCDGETISGANASTQTVVVGQTITLATTPTAAQVAILPISLTFASTTWTLPQTPANIGGDVLGTLDAKGNPTTFSTTPTVPTNPGLNTYWLYPNPKVPVTYTYCVAVPNAGNQCSPTKATANFNVTGPTAKITPSLSSINSPAATGTWSVSPQYPGCLDANNKKYQFLIFGLLNPPSTGCTRVVDTPGIGFAATGINLANVTAPAGDFLWVQLITTDTLTGTETGVKVLPTYLGTGLDNSYPYSSAGTQTNDSPNVGLANSLATETRAFTAQMYLLWNSNLDSASIEVPIGYVTWSINGTADQNTKKTPPWYLAANQKTATTTYTASSDTGAPAHGLPVWQAITYSGPTSNGELESVPTDGEEENQQ